MKTGVIQGLCIFICFIILTSCIESYPPPIVDGAIDFLVIDGSVNGTEGSVSVELNHAVALSSTELPRPELNAKVNIEDNDGNIYLLNELGNGRYSQSGLPLSTSNQY